MSAEYIASEGNQKIILCERGIRTYETATRNTFDVSSIPVVKSLSHLPVIADPSHAAGRWRWWSRSPRPRSPRGGRPDDRGPPPAGEGALRRSQSLRPDAFLQVIGRLRKVAEAVGGRCSAVARERVGILGLGLIGGSLALALKGKRGAPRCGGATEGRGSSARRLPPARSRAAAPRRSFPRATW